MALFNSTSFISLILLVSFLLAPSAEAQQKSASRAHVRRAPATRIFHRVGVGVISIPQELTLKSSLGNQENILTASNGISLSYDLEGSRGRWTYYGTLGVSLVGLKASSETDAIEYSFADASYLNYMLGGGFYYLVERSVRAGFGVRTFYDNYTLPNPTGSGVIYEFDYGDSIKNYLSLDLQWQIFPSFLLSQSFLYPLSAKQGSAWLISVKFQIR